MNIRIILVLIVIITIFNSCTVLNQKAYFANPPNVNCFQTEKEKNLKLSQGLNHFEAQSNIAFNKNIGISTGLYGGFKGQYGVEIAGIIYNKFNDNNYFESQIGYSYFINKSKESGGEMFIVIPGQDINTKYHKIFIQPTYFLTSKHINIGIAIKLNAVYFEKYHYYYDYHFYPEDDDYVSHHFFTADFNHKWNFVCEPTINIQLNRAKLYFQISGIFSNKIYDFQTYSGYSRHEGPISNIAESGKAKNPQHVNFLFTIGHIFKYKKKK